MYEGGLRSPSIARWPERIKAGAVSQQVWTFWDFLPTMAQLTGQRTPGGIDGVSILPTLLEGRAVEHPPLYFEFHERGFTQAARIGDWKAVRLGTKKPIELYDLNTDLAETKDVASQHPDVVKRFDEYLKAARVDSPQWPIRENAGNKTLTQRREEGLGIGIPCPCLGVGFGTQRQFWAFDRFARRFYACSRNVAQLR